MKKFLLFLALAAITSGLNAQRFTTRAAAKPAKALTAQPTKLSLKADRASQKNVFRAPNRMTSTAPSAEAYRPYGYFWFTQTYETSWGQDGLGFGPANVSSAFEGTFDGEESKWIYAVETDANGTPLWREQEVNGSDSVLILQFDQGYWPAPAAVASSLVGTNPLKATQQSDTATCASVGLIIGQSSSAVFQNNTTGEYVDIPVGNFDPTLYVGSASIGQLFAINSDAANANLANAFGGAAAGITSAETLAFGEYMAKYPQAEALLKGVDMFIINEEEIAPEASDLNIAILPVDENGRIGNPIGFFEVGDVTEALRYQDGALFGFGVHFVPAGGAPALLIDGDYFIQIINTQESTYSWAPVTFVVANSTDGAYGYAFVSLVGTENGEEFNDVFPQSVNVFNWGSAAYSNPTILAGVNLSYDAEEIVAFREGINTPTANKFDRNLGTFDLQGRRIAAPAKGVFIQNGQKVIK